MMDEGIYNALVVLLIFMCVQVSISLQAVPRDFQIVFPTQVGEDGNFLSYWSPTAHARQRRSTHNSSRDLLLNITGFSQTFRIRVHQNTQLTAPGFRVYHRIDGNTSRDEVVKDNCVYHGDTDSISSRAALSLCGGVAGLLRTSSSDYVIEPKPDHIQWQQSKFSDSHRSLHPHIMYKAVSAGHMNFLDLNSERDENYSFQDSGIYFNPPRRKRSSYPEKSVETLVVVDQNAYWKHGRNEITPYILSMFNIVSQLFQDESLGYNIRIVLVGLVILEGEEPGLSITHHADKTLNSFCQWQSLIGGRRHRQHDHAVLLTGLNICAFRNSPCDTLGFAPIEGMCDRRRSCTVVEDSGLSTAFTIAHELGHNFGMHHDGRNNPCHRNSGTIMSETLSSSSGTFRWSSCSHGYLRRFFNTVQSNCLVDLPQGVAELKFPDKLPGQIFNADIQCQWQFGKSAKLCIFEFGKREVCQKLWCYKGGRVCETKFLPAADGTSCGAGMWCIQGKCERYGAQGPQPRHGGWSAWSEWGHCSQHCGGGVKKRQRTCDNPAPQYGGDPCQGEDTVYKMCSLQRCHQGSKDARSQQCEAFNHQPFRGWNYKWKPYTRIYDVAEQCKLYCQAVGYNFFYALSKQVKDGTLCNEYSNQICVQGSCKSVGCDYVVGSTARNDICGVCNGNNSTCNIYEGEFRKQPRRNTYFPIAVIPAGASSIRFAELAISSSYLAVRSVFGKYFLNGDWHLMSEGTYVIAGANFIYKRSYREPESLTSSGPTTEDIVLEILCQGVNPGITYRYTLPKVSRDLPRPSHNYTWSVKLSPCSQPCAGGSQTSSAHCYRSDGEEVTPQYCRSRSRPDTGVTACNTHSCPSRWFTLPWNQCSKTCGGGHQRRKVICKQKVSQSEDRRVSRRRCKSLPRPHRKISCNTQECPPVWHGSKWSECSVTCGKGTRTRRVTCRSRTARGWVVLPHSMCQHQRRIPEVKRCQTPKCRVQAEWIITTWSECSMSCGGGRRTRHYHCVLRRNPERWTVVEESLCAGLPHPDSHLEERCNQGTCPSVGQPYWNLSPWSQCSVSCGDGRQTRLVHCLDRTTEELSKTCDANTKPEAIRRCSLKPCPVLDPNCIDSFPWCELVPQHNICNHHFYGKKCCRSCQKASGKG